MLSANKNVDPKSRTKDVTRFVEFSPLRILVTGLWKTWMSKLTTAGAESPCGVCYSEFPQRNPAHSTEVACLAHALRIEMKLVTSLLQSTAVCEPNQAIQSSERITRIDTNPRIRTLKTLAKPWTTLPLRCTEKFRLVTASLDEIRRSERHTHETTLNEPCAGEPAADERAIQPNLCTTRRSRANTGKGFIAGHRALPTKEFSSLRTHTPSF